MLVVDSAQRLHDLVTDAQTLSMTKRIADGSILGVQLPQIVLQRLLAQLHLDVQADFSLLPTVALVRRHLHRVASELF